MAKPEEKKKTSPLLWIGLLGLGVAGYVLTEPEDVVPKSVARRQTEKKIELPEGFVEADFKAKFATLNTPPKNSFQPQVIALKDRGGNVAPNALPGIDGGAWVFTGTAEVGGKKMALIENGATGEGQFLQVGDDWGTFSVSSISDNVLNMKASDGSTRMIRMEGSVDGETENMAAAPITVPGPRSQLRGPIGGIDVRPLNANASPQQNPTGNQLNAN